MYIVILVFALVSIAVVIATARHTHATGKALAQRIGTTKLLPKGVGALLIVAHFSELLHAVEHVSIVHVAIALFLLLAWRIGSTGHESDLY